MPRPPPQRPGRPRAGSRYAASARGAMAVEVALADGRAEAGLVRRPAGRQARDLASHLPALEPVDRAARSGRSRRASRRGRAPAGTSPGWFGSSSRYHALASSRRLYVAAPASGTSCASSCAVKRSRSVEAARAPTRRAGSSGRAGSPRAPPVRTTPIAAARVSQSRSSAVTMNRSMSASAAAALTASDPVTPDEAGRRGRERWPRRRASLAARGRATTPRARGGESTRSARGREECEAVVHAHDPAQMQRPRSRPRPRRRPRRSAGTGGPRRGAQRPVEGVRVAERVDDRHLDRSQRPGATASIGRSRTSSTNSSSRTALAARRKQERPDGWIGSPGVPTPAGHRHTAATARAVPNPDPRFRRRLDRAKRNSVLGNRQQRDSRL